MAAQVHGFQTEVAKLLKLLANSLYSNKEVFLRELISNASDAIDKLRFLSITKPELAQEDPVLRIRVRADRDAGTLTISDNGIGMTLAEANERLGTIANSGTEDFLSKLSADDAKSSQLIGQFGVGFTRPSSSPTASPFARAQRAPSPTKPFAGPRTARAPTCRRRPSRPTAART